MTAVEFSAVRMHDNDFELVWEAAKRVRDAETADLAADGLRRLCTEDGCELNVKAITFALERLNRKTYGRDESGHSEGGSGPKNVYNIVIQGFPQGQPCGNLATNPTSTPVIDA